MTKANGSMMDLDRLHGALAAAETKNVYATIVNAPFEQRVAAAFLFLGIMVYLRVNPRTNTIDRIALSNTELAKRTTDVSVVPFEEIKIPLGQADNIIAQAIERQHPKDTTDWKFLFDPALTAEQARINQANAGIAYSAVYPLATGDGGALIFSYFQYDQGLGQAQRDFMAAYAAMVDERLSRG
jgi:hypothetical protein